MISLVKNIEKLEEFLNEFSRKPEIICISEIRTNDKNIHSVALPRYSFYSNNSSTKAGAVGIYVVDSFYCQEITNVRLNLLGCEDIWSEVSLNDKTNLVVGTVYRHPQPNCLKFSQAFYSNLRKLKICGLRGKETKNKKFVVLGDFNVKYGCYTADSAVKMFADTISSLGCEQLISWPSRISPSKQSILDNIYVNNSMVNSVVSPAVITHSLSDHFPTIIHLKLTTKRKDENRPLIRILKPHLIENFIEDINSKL